MSKDVFLDLRVGLLVESMSRSDKKEIEKMISKAIAAEKTSNERVLKKELKKAVKAELSSKDVKKMISEIVASEVSAGLKNGEAKEMTVDITKRVLVRLYRELAYNYTPVIDRIKI